MATTPTTEPDAATIALFDRLIRVAKVTHDTSLAVDRWPETIRAILDELAAWQQEQREGQP